MSDQQIIGKDVSGYAVTGANGTLSFLGKWETVEVDVKFNYSTATAADASEPYKRFTTKEWTANLSQFADTNFGSAALLLSTATNPVIQIIFKDNNSGKTIDLYGSISDANFNAGMDAWKDKLGVESIGPRPDGTPSFQYY